MLVASTISVCERKTYKLMCDLLVQASGRKTVPGTGKTCTISDGFGVAALKK